MEPWLPALGLQLTKICQKQSNCAKDLVKTSSRALTKKTPYTLSSSLLFDGSSLICSWDFNITMVYKYKTSVQAFMPIIGYCSNMVVQNIKFHSKDDPLPYNYILIIVKTNNRFWFKMLIHSFQRCLKDLDSGCLKKCITITFWKMVLWIMNTNKKC